MRPRERAAMVRRLPSSLALTAVLLTVAAGETGATSGRLEVFVTGLRSDAGRVHIALYDRAEAFPSSDGMRRKARVDAKGLQARHVFETLPLGRYALAVFHDENGNGDFDQGLFGFPLEGYAFSRDVRPFLGPPRFESAAFDIADKDGRVTVRMRY